MSGERVRLYFERNGERVPITTQEYTFEEVQHADPAVWALVSAGAVREVKITNVSGVVAIYEVIGG